MYKQVIIARKDLHMSPGKLAAQVSHASMAFLTTMIRESAAPTTNYANAVWGTPIEEIEDPYGIAYYECDNVIDKDLFEQWICGSFTKTVLQAKNKNHLMKAVQLAKEMELKEGKDFFLIKDNCYTELTPEEVDEDGVGQTLTCIGFKPMDSDVIDKIGKKYHLYV